MSFVLTGKRKVPGNLSLLKCFQMIQMFRKSANHGFIFPYAGTAFLILFTVGMTGSIAIGNRNERSAVAVHPGLAASKAVAATEKFSCLPKGISADDVVSYGLKGMQKVTVERRLIELKARCRSGKLVDAKGREIRFFRTSCWGNPPVDYLEIQQRENKELSELKKRYTVIVFGCNPMIQ